jgi:hypothetical protein
MKMSLRHSRGSFLQKKSHFFERGRRFSFLGFSSALPTRIPVLPSVV